MKKFLRFVLSLCLIAACIFGLLSAYAGVQDVLNIKAYKEDDLARAQDGLEQARDGIAQLKENEQTYLDGVDTYTEGLAAYADGQARLADGAVQLQDGEAQLAAGSQQIAQRMMPAVRKRVMPPRICANRFSVNSSASGERMQFLLKINFHFFFSESA